MKGGLAAALVGVAAASEGLRAPVAVSASVLEEAIEGVALAEVLDRLTPEAVVICEPSWLGVRIGQRGRAEVLITAHGVPAHAASPERGRNPISLAARGLQHLEGMTVSEDPPLGSAIIVVTDVVSDPYPSISLIPSGVTMRFDRRTLRDEEESGVLEALQAALREVDADGFTVSLTESEVVAGTGARVAARQFFPAWTLPPEHPLVLITAEAVRGAGLEPEIGIWGFCTNGSESAGARGIPTVGLGPGQAEAMTKGRSPVPRPQSIAHCFEWFEPVLAPDGEGAGDVIGYRLVLSLVAVRHHDRGVGVLYLKLDGDQLPEGTQAETIVVLEALRIFLETRSFECGDVPIELHGMFRIRKSPRQCGNTRAQTRDPERASLVDSTGSPTTSSATSTWSRAMA